MSNRVRGGPLAGLRVVEFASIGPGPHGVMLLSDLGAEVLRIDRPGGNGWPNPIVDRGRHTLEIDIRNEAGRASVLEIVDHADVVIEGNRPGVMEGLSLGPSELLERNARLIYARITGWGQTGPLANTAGHDINYIALTGALAAITGTDGLPIPPLNLVGDFGGGSLYLVVGILAALWERERSGKGQVVDAAIVDGVISMMTMFAGSAAPANISLQPEKNLLGGRAPFYRCYECADGKYISVGSLEPHFYAELLSRIGAPNELVSQRDPADWPQVVTVLSRLFKQRTRDDWCELLQGSDACFAPVLTYEESLQNPHLMERLAYIEAAGIQQAAPSPRFSRTPASIGPSGDATALIDRWRDSNNKKALVD